MTNKIEELNKELDELQAKIEEVQKKIEEAKQAEWPQNGDVYWHIYGDGSINFTAFDSSYNLNTDRLMLGNCFKTKEDAEFEVEHLKVTAELKKFAMTREEVWAARNRKTIHYLYMDTDDALITSTNCSARTPVLYFADEFTVREAIKAVGEERIRKYYFGLED